ncbi:hypothetical protein NFI96_022682 [Prochilodus magdalenae]|nr:hypothetical protein NFI96_022682 [Prochilodus magdalenae]
MLLSGRLALWLLVSGAARAALAAHDGVCPNELNANLWVDAQSTCERECETDQRFALEDTLPLALDTLRPL